MSTDGREAKAGHDGSPESSSQKVHRRQGRERRPRRLPQPFEHEPDDLRDLKTMSSCHGCWRTLSDPRRWNPKSRDADQDPCKGADQLSMRHTASNPAWL